MKNKKQVNAYNMLIMLGRALEASRKGYAEELSYEVILKTISVINHDLLWTPVADFFRLFPPIKRYCDDGCWDYYSTIKYIDEELGENFGKDDFIKLLMTHCYENLNLRLVGVAYASSLSNLKRKRTGTGLLEEFFSSY